MAELPLNMVEFNTLSGLILAQLYQSFPMETHLHKDKFAELMGITERELRDQKLPSGILFISLWSSTLDWLCEEGFTRRIGRPDQSNSLTLTMQGLRVLNAVPPGLQQTVGTAVIEGGQRGDLTGIGDLVGGVIGGFTKSITGG